MVKRVLVVGGVAGGATCAARVRRLAEDAEIVVFDRGPYVSFANCGLPYYVGNVIEDEKKLLLASAELFRARFNIEVRTENEVMSIDRERREIEVKRLQTGEVYHERYDALVLSPGAMPIQPALPGVNLPGIFVLRTIPDSRQIRRWIEDHKVQRAVIVGGGLVGMAGAAVRDVDRADLVPVQPLVQFRARGQDREGRDQKHPKQRGRADERRMACLSGPGHGVLRSPVCRIRQPGNRLCRCGSVRC